ncbi:MAG: DUF4197 domain-containing protein [Rhodospirillales bacterium]
MAAGPAGAQGLLDKAKSLLGGSGSGGGALSNQDVANGLKEALRVGADRVVAALSAVDGFNANPDIHIPLPASLQKAQSALRTVGLSGMADDLELRLNRAAEAAAPEARQLFWNAVSTMTFDDARKIYDGPDDAATSYFRGRMTPDLTSKFTPVVDESLREVGAIRAYDDMMGSYKSLPFVPDVSADLSSHVVTRALDGLFLMLAREEKAIRENPAARTTELLRKVFSR